MQPKFFQIGFNKCGTTYIARLFEMNAIPTAHWLEGALAEDIAYAKLTGQTPLAPWADRITAFTDMESARFLNTPIVEAFKDFALLDAHYPGAVFLLNTRRIEDWVTSRYLHRGGAYARSHAASLGVALGDLADIWAADWTAHLARARQHFAGRPEFIPIDIDEATPEDYRRALAPWFDLRQLPDLPGAGVRKARLQNLPRLRQMLEQPPWGAGITPSSRRCLARHLAALAAPARLSPVAAPDAPHDQAVCLDLDRNELRGADGALLPMRRGADGWFYLQPQRPGLLRVATTVNDIAQLADRGRYWLDMRPFGPELPARSPLIVCLRRAGAANLFLWPAPWLHRIGNDGFPGAPIVPQPRFEDRPDLATWRGTLSGRTDTCTTTAEQLITQLAKAAPGSANMTAAATALQRLTRWCVPATHGQGDDLDLGYLPDRRLTQALHHAGLKRPARVAEDVPACRYALCLASSQGDADFLPLVLRQSLILREETDWQGFATALFRPWRHYVPLEKGAVDLSQRLSWARANPARSGQIARRACRLAARLADPAGRRLHLQHVLAAYRTATGQP